MYAQYSFLHFCYTTSPYPFRIKLVVLRLLAELCSDWLLLIQKHSVFQTPLRTAV